LFGKACRDQISVRKSGTPKHHFGQLSGTIIAKFIDKK
jgi:hypothetical protein